MDLLPLDPATALLEDRVIRGKSQGTMGRRLDLYAKNQRRIRSLQPKVSSAEAHEQARQALAKAGQPQHQPPPNSPARASNSSAGRKDTGGSSTVDSKTGS